MVKCCLRLWHLVRFYAAWVDWVCRLHTCKADRDIFVAKEQHWPAMKVWSQLSSSALENESEKFWSWTNQFRMLTPILRFVFTSIRWAMLNHFDVLLKSFCFLELARIRQENGFTSLVWIMVYSPSLTSKYLNGVCFEFDLHSVLPSWQL